MQTTPVYQLPYLTSADKAKAIPEQSKKIATTLETIIQSGDLRGLPGDRGLPGVNAVPADEAVATYLETEGTKTSLAAAVLVDAQVSNAMNLFLDTRVRSLVTSESMTRDALDARYARKGAGGGGGGGGAEPNGMISVLTYGAVGDGVTDDSDAIQYALDLNEGVLVFPRGMTFIIGITLRLKKNTTIFAYGATIKRNAQCTHMVRNFREQAFGGIDDEFPGYTGNGNIKIFGGTWDCNQGVGTGGNAFTFAHAAGLVFRDMDVINNHSHAFDIPGIDGATFDNVRMLGFLPSESHKEAIQIDSCISGAASMRPLDGTITKNVWVRNCVFGPLGTKGPPGRAIGSHSVSSLGIPFENINVLDCEIQATLSRGISAYAWNGFRIEGNDIKGTPGRGISVSTPTGYKVTSGWVQHNRVKDNASDFAICVISEGTAADLANIQVMGNTSEGSSNIALVIGLSTNCVAGMNHVYGAATSNPNGRSAVAIGSGAVDPYVYLNTVGKSGASEQAQIALSVNSSAVRPRYVMNNFLNGLTIADSNSGSITS